MTAFNVRAARLQCTLRTRLTSLPMSYAISPMLEEQSKRTTLRAYLVGLIEWVVPKEVHL